jgi:FAD/FMN-containing dehydrogenase
VSDIDRLTRDNRHFEFWAFPYADNVSTRISNPTTDPPNVSGLKRFWENVVVDTAGLLVLSHLGRLRPLAKHIARLSPRLNSEDDSVDDSFRMLATPRHVKLREMEYAVPAAAGPDCLRDILAAIDASQFQVTFPIQYRYVAADDLFLSPFYEQASALIDVQQFHKLPHEPYFRACEAVFRRYGGRPHWGKIHYRSAEELRDLYPKWDDFQRIRRELDPHGIFLSPYVKRLFGI